MTTAPTLPEPGDASVADRVQISHRFIQHARDELNRGHRLQASEKAWGALTQMLKAHGQQRGWLNLTSHRTVGHIARQLAAEYGDPDISEAYIAGTEAHENFYENYMRLPQIKATITTIANVLPRLESALGEPPRPYTIREEDLWRLRTLTGKQNLEVGDESPTGFSNRHQSTAAANGDGAAR